MAATIRPVRVNRGDVDAARDFRVDFVKARTITRFQNQFARGQKTIGSHLKFICSNSFIVPSTLIIYHPWHLQYILEGNEI